jgi:hypothetical protein
LPQVAARLAGGFASPASAEQLEHAIQEALDEGGFDELERARHLPGKKRKHFASSGSRSRYQTNDGQRRVVNIGHSERMTRIIRRRTRSPALLLELQKLEAALTEADAQGDRT